MRSQGRIFNELGAGEIAVWCRLNPGIDPSQWALLCRLLGSLSPSQFDDIYSRTRSRRHRLKSAVKRRVVNLLGFDGEVSEGLPLVSAGPSGLDRLEVTINYSTNPML